MELYQLKGTHIMTGKKYVLTVLLKRRKDQRPIDVVLDNMDLGGMHVHSVIKINAGRLRPVTVIETKEER